MFRSSISYLLLRGGLPILWLAACQFDTGGLAVTPPPNANPLQGCSLECHGNELTPAPPNDTSQMTATTARSVGAHSSHMNLAPTWHRKVQCDDCHVVPDTVDAAGHNDTPLPAELTFSAMAGGSQAAWNGTTCANVYCHGSTLSGGEMTEPQWTKVDNSQKRCDSCHGFPPPAPHPPSQNCGTCHSTIQPGTLPGATDLLDPASHLFLDPDSHIDGKVDTATGNASCDTCHGSDGISAPPRDLDGDTDFTARGVGAHRAHYGASTKYRPMTCSQCHQVPTSADAPGHRDGDNRAELKFDTLNSTARYDDATGTCQNLYCHGNGRSSQGSIQWTANIDMTCSSCHGITGNGMSGAHADHLESGVTCTDCHGTVVDQNQNIIDANLHIDGVHQVRMQRGSWDPPRRRCLNTACHNGSRNWDVSAD